MVRLLLLFALSALSVAADDCVNDDSTTDSDGGTCSTRYDSNPGDCGSADDDDFTASEQCCACATTDDDCVNDESTTDLYGADCTYYDYYPSECGYYDNEDFTASLQCCACGGFLCKTSAPTTTPAPTETPCVDDDSTNDLYGYTCSSRYDSSPSDCGCCDDDDFTASEQCCACGGGLPGGTFAPTMVSLTLAGYATATNVRQHARIDEWMQQLEWKVGEYQYNTAWVEDAMLIYANGGHSVDDSGEIRTLKGFATSGEAEMTGWTMYSIYYAYWNDYNYADTFITKDYSATVKNAGVSQLIKKGASYQAVWMYVLHKLESAISGCKAGDSNAVHSWDEGWAYYAGSLVGVTAADAVTDRGVLLLISSWEILTARSCTTKTMATPRHRSS